MAAAVDSALTGWMMEVAQDFGAFSAVQCGARFKLGEGVDFATLPLALVCVDCSFSFGLAVG